MACKASFQDNEDVLGLRDGAGCFSLKIYKKPLYCLWSSDGQESACNAEDAGLIPGSGRPPGGGHGCPFRYSCLENPMDGGAWRATV